MSVDVYVHAVIIINRDPAGRQIGCVGDADEVCFC